MDIAQLAFEIDSSKARRAAGDLGGVSKAAKKAETASERMEREVNSLTGGLGRLRNVALSAVAAIGGFAAIRGAIGEIAEFERGLIGVSKTTGITGRDLEGLADDIREIGERVPVATTELLSLGQSAGQLGVKGRDNIARFTETIAKLGTASDLAGEEAATAFARILTVTGTPISEVDRLGASIVQLGNNFAATESEISSAATRVAQSTSQFGVGADEVLGIGAALRSVGVEAEAGGTQIGLAFQSINDAIRNGGEQMRLLQEVTGETSEALRQSFFGGESTRVFEQFVQGLGRIQDSGGDVSAVLEEFDLNGTRAIQVLGTLATRSGVLADALRQASTGYEENVALNREAEVASQSLSDQLQILRNSFSNLLTGTDISPLTESVKELSAALQSAEVKESAQEIVQFAIDLSKEAVIAAEDLGGLIEEIKDLLNIDTETERVADLSVELVQLNRRLAELEEFDGDGVAANLMSPFGQNASKPIQEIRDRIAEVEKELYDIPLATRSVTEALDRLGQYGILTDFRPAPGLSQTPLIFRAIAEEGEKAGDGAGAAGDGLDEAREAARQAEQSYSDLRDELELENEVLRIRLDQGEEAAEAFREEALLRERLNEIRGETNVIGETEIDQAVRQQEINRELNEELENREQAEREATRAAEREAEKRARIAEREAEAFQRPFENAAENIQRSFGDMFTDIYRGGTDIFEDFAGTVKDIFARLAGEITALFVTRGLGQLLAGGGGLSISGVASASGGGLLGELGGGLGGLTDLAASIPGIGQVLDVAQAFQAGFQNTGLGGGFQAAIDQSFLSAPTTAGGSLFAAGAGGFGGYQAGNLLNSLGVTQGGGTGSSIGGGIGGAIGSFAGPIGTVVGSAGGSFIGGGIEQLLSGETFVDKVTGGLDALFPGVGSLVDGVLSGLDSVFGGGGDLINVAPVTRAGSSLDNIEGPVLRDGPFGNVGLSRQYGQGQIPGDVIRNLTQSVADFDQQVSEFLTQSQIGDVSSFLQSQDVGLGMGAGSGTGFGEGVDDEDIADLLANRFSQIFDALDLQLPEVVEKATRNKLDELGITTEQVLEAGLAPLAQIQAQREAAAEQVRNAVGAGEAGQTIQDVFDELSIATDQLPRTREELTAFVEGLNETQQAGLSPIIGQLQQFVATSEQASAQVEAQALAVQRAFGLADTAFEEYLETLGTSAEQLPRTQQGLQDFIAGLDEAEQAGLQPFIGELRSLVSASEDAADATQSAAAAARERAIVEQEREDLQIRLLEAQGKEIEALAKRREQERRAIDESNQALLDKIFAEEDLARAREEEAERERERAREREERAREESLYFRRLRQGRELANEMTVELFELRGESQKAVELSRELELNRIPDVAGRQNIVNLQELIYRERDAAEAREASANAAEEAARRAEEAAQSIDRLNESLRGVTQSISEQIAELRGESVAAVQIDSVLGSLDRVTGLQGLVGIGGEIQAALTTQYEEQLAAIERQTQQTRTQNSAIESNNNALREQLSIAERMSNVAQGIRDYVISLESSDLSTGAPLDRLAAAQDEFSRLTAAARGGDADAAASLQNQADTVLTLARDLFASSPEYAAIYDQIRSSLGATADEIDVADTQLEALRDQIEATQNVGSQSVANTSAITSATDQLNEQLADRLERVRGVLKLIEDVTLLSGGEQVDAIGILRDQLAAVIQEGTEASVEGFQELKEQLEAAREGQSGGGNAPVSGIGDGDVSGFLSGLDTNLTNASTRDIALGQLNELRAIRASQIDGSKSWASINSGLLAAVREDTQSMEPNVLDIRNFMEGAGKRQERGNKFLLDIRSEQYDNKLEVIRSHETLMNMRDRVAPLPALLRRANAHSATGNMELEMIRLDMEGVETAVNDATAGIHDISRASRFSAGQSWHGLNNKRLQGVESNTKAMVEALKQSQADNAQLQAQLAAAIQVLQSGFQQTVQQQKQTNQNTGQQARRDRLGGYEGWRNAG